jgi:hypothetical protein
LLLSRLPQLRLSNNVTGLNRMLAVIKPSAKWPVMVLLQYNNPKHIKRRLHSEATTALANAQ